MTCEIIAYLLTRGLGTALNAAAAEVVRIQHPKFAALSVCELNPDHVSEGQARAHKIVRACAEQGLPGDRQNDPICMENALALGRLPRRHIGGSAHVYPAGPRVVGGPVIANAPSARLHVYAAPTSG
jgi:hypothetical protein